MIQIGYSTKVGVQFSKKKKMEVNQGYSHQVYLW